jgi:probable phosphoglycerate mutase
VRLFVLTRHAHSTLNVEGRINGDPSVPVLLTDEGRAEATRLGTQLANLPLDLCVHTRFARTRETAAYILGGREVALLEEPLLDDIDVGELEGETLEAYRAWKREHARSDPFPGGESLDDAARRYADAFRHLLARTEAATLVVCHEIPIRYALNGAASSSDLDAPAHAVPNATPYLFDDVGLERAAAGIDRAIGGREGMRRLRGERGWAG